MSAQSSEETALGGLRVLDLANENGLYCGKLLADLGADVIKVEKPGGDATRNMGPFWHDIAHPEKSLLFAYLNTNKRGITLNIESVEGREIFRRLAKGADIIIETYVPGYLESIGLGYSSLKELNRGLILTSITGFGQTGPYKDFKSSDFVSFAMGTTMFLTGDPDKPPVQAGGHMMYFMVSVYSAIATLIALYYRNMTGIGQQVDSSMQEAMSSTTEHAAQAYSYDGVIETRLGSIHPGPSSAPAALCPCKDGYVNLGVGGRPADWNSLISWMISDGVDVGEFADPVWESGNMRLSRLEDIDALCARWAKRYTKQELFHECQKRGWATTPTLTVEEVVADPQLEARNFFVEVEHPQMGSFKYPGAPYKLSETPWAIRRPSPLIGQHNEEVYGELGFSKEELITLKGAGVI